MSGTCIRPPLRALDRRRQVLAHVNALSQEYRHDADRRAPAGDERIHRMIEIGLHELEKGKAHGQMRA
jgi:hypothetical protein